MSANGQYQDDDNAEDEYDDVDSPAPIDPEEPIDFSLVYALHTFVANLEGQVCVLKGDSLELLDDSNSYWWLVKCIKTDEIGYIPAENVETPFERLARLNKMRNVHVASVQSQDLEAINVQKKGVPRNVVFPDTFVEYIENSDTEDSDEYDDELLRSNRSSNSLQRPKLNAGSLSRNFLSKLLGRGKKVKASSGTATAGGVAGTTRAVSDNVNTATADAGKSDKEPLNVLRIYAGNTDLKATFKTVALTKQMAATDLLSAALKRFRIPAQNIHEYYLSLLHMDSQEKRLSETDNIYNTLEELRHKSLPGLTTNSPLLVSSFINPKGGISRVRMTDDNIIKVIINKKLNLFEKDFHLIRIFMYDESDDTGRLRTYKTIGVGSEARVEEIVEVAKKKFQLPKDRRWEYTLHSIFRGEETLRNPSEPIYPILLLSSSSPEEIDFVLRRHWTGSGPSPSQAPSARRLSSADSEKERERNQQEDVERILSHKPKFLEDVPAATSYNINSHLNANDSENFVGMSGSDSNLGSLTNSVSNSFSETHTEEGTSSDSLVIAASDESLSRSRDHTSTESIGRSKSPSRQASPTSSLSSSRTPPRKFVSGDASTSADPARVPQRTASIVSSGSQSSGLGSILRDAPVPPSSIPSSYITPGLSSAVASRQGSLRYDAKVLPVPVFTEPVASYNVGGQGYLPDTSGKFEIAHGGPTDIDNKPLPDLAQEQTSPLRPVRKTSLPATGVMPINPGSNAADAKVLPPTPTSGSMENPIQRAEEPIRLGPVDISSDDSRIGASLSGSTSPPVGTSPTSASRGVHTKQTSSTINNGGSETSPFNSSTSIARASRIPFESMELHLEEIMRNPSITANSPPLLSAASDPLSSPVTSFSNSNSSLYGSSTFQPLRAPARINSLYDDCGLNEFLSSRPRSSSFDASISSSATNRSGKRPSIQRAGTSSTHPHKLSTIFDSLEVELDGWMGTLAKSPKFTDSSGPNVDGQQIPEASTGESAIPEKGTEVGKVQLRLSDTFGPQRTTPTAVTDVGSPGSSSTASPHEPSETLNAAVSSGIAARSAPTTGRNPATAEYEYDSAVVLDKYREVEAMLSSMQQDLEQLVQSAADAFDPAGTEQSTITPSRQDSASSSTSLTDYSRK